MSNVNKCRKHPVMFKNTGWKTTVVLLVVLLLAFLISSCDFLGGLMEEKSRTEEYTIKSNLTGTNILAVTNTSSVDATLNFSYAERSAVQKNTAIEPRLTGNWKSVVPRMGTEAISRFNANPPPIQQGSSRSVEDPRYAPKDYNPNSQKFWVTTAQDKFYEITTKRQAYNDYCNVWVHEDCIGTGKGKIDVTQAQALADKFGEIYPLETKLLGFERGGGIATTASGYGGVDGDPKIQILVYDIADDGVVGYFWSKDEYTQKQLDDDGNGSYKSNEAEIFYIDVEFYNGDLGYEPELVYSTLIHEFQHMINYNQKPSRLGNNFASQTWYDEMLAMLSEDVIGPLVGITATSDGHVIQKRIPLFLGGYWIAGINEWLEGGDVMFSYSAVYAFGAYLIRNYGGPKLLEAMLSNNYANQNSVTQALKTVNGDNTLSFDKALDRYAEALLYSPKNTGSVPSGKMTFNITKEYPVTINGISKTYTAHAFDIWNMAMDEYLLESFQEQVPDLVSDYTKGPIIFPLQTGYQIPGYSVRLHKLNNSKDAGETLVMEIKPESATIDLKVVSY